MFRNYLKTGWRNLVKHKFYTAVSIVGLSAGIAFTLLIAGYVWSEYQVNRTVKNVDRIYLLESDWNDHAGAATARSIGPIAKTLKEQYPSLVANYYRWDWVSTIVSAGENHFRDSIQIGDTTLVSMFGFPLLYGDNRTLFDNPDAVVITAAKAMKYFGKTDVIGKSLRILNYSGKQKDFVVSGVLKDLPNNSVTHSLMPVNLSINSTFIALPQLKFFYTGLPADDHTWNYTSFTSFIELQKGVTPQQLTAPLRNALALHRAESVNSVHFNLYPLKSYNLDSNDGIIRKTIYTLCFVALFILVMAIVNFVNISIANASSRLKEMGIRKVLGGVKKQLMGQLLIESIILVFISVSFSLIIYQCLTPWFQQLLGKPVPALTSYPIQFVLVPFALIIIIGVLAGIYPAGVLASVRSAESVKGKLTAVKENILLRKSLVGFQFGVAMIVFTAAIVISQQVSYSLNKDLGFSKEQVINVALPRNWTKEGVRQMETLRNELATVPGITNASLCYSIPNRNVSNYTDLYPAGGDSTKTISAFTFFSDEKYAATFGIPLITGRFFNAGGGSLSAGSVVLNETAVKALHFPSAAAAIGHQIKTPGSDQWLTIDGVVKDYHFESNHEQIKPVIFFHVQNNTIYRFITCKLAGGSIQNTIRALQQTWLSLMPATPFEYTFMDETLQHAYQNEIQLQKASYTATILAVIIVLLGIAGIVSLSIAKRTKEIGIRKVLGASLTGIISLFIKEMISVMIIAAVAACPAAWMIMKIWLNDYAYRIDLSIMPFVWVTGTMAALTCLLVGGQTIKAAITKPVTSLRSE